ncbi:transposase [Bradyrhizobium japonicum]
MSEPRSDSKSFEVLTASPVRLSKSPARRYRSWSDEEKARIVGETLTPGANVSAIVRSNGVDSSLLFAWRRKAVTSRVVAPGKKGASGPVKFVRFDAARSDMMEIVLGGDVEAALLVDVIRAVREA